LCATIRMSPFYQLPSATHMAIFNFKFTIIMLITWPVSAIFMLQYRSKKNLSETSVLPNHYGWQLGIDVSLENYRTERILFLSFAHVRSDVRLSYINSHVKSLWLVNTQNRVEGEQKVLFFFRSPNVSDIFSRRCVEKWASIGSDNDAGSDII
jgi:hypothetical protein